MTSAKAGEAVGGFGVGGDGGEEHAVRRAGGGGEGADDDQQAEVFFDLDAEYQAAADEEHEELDQAHDSCRRNWLAKDLGAGDGVRRSSGAEKYRHRVRERDSWRRYLRAKKEELDRPTADAGGRGGAFHIGADDLLRFEADDFGDGVGLPAFLAGWWVAWRVGVRRWARRGGGAVGSNGLGQSTEAEIAGRHVSLNLGFVAAEGAADGAGDSAVELLEAGVAEEVFGAGRGTGRGVQRTLEENGFLEERR